MVIGKTINESKDTNVVILDSCREDEVYRGIYFVASVKLQLTRHTLIRSR